MNILANDGISPSGLKALKDAGHEVYTDFIEADKLEAYINDKSIDGILVRSATKVRQELMDACSGLKFVGRGGVGMDNIDVEYGRNKGLTVFNTPAASSQSVAELVMGHLFTLSRSLHASNRKMPLEGSAEFKALKKAYGKGSELRGKTLGIIGFGRIGRSLASYALGCGMDVIAHDIYATDSKVEFDVCGTKISVDCPLMSMEEVLKMSDAVSLHIPAQPDGSAVIGTEQLDQMKPGSLLVNAARGGVLDEDALLKALNSGHLGGAALDVFVGEPTPRADVLSHRSLSLTPHTGAATSEAQDRIGLELASQIDEIANKMS
ncbi:MAG TPA: 3-phosphoglycerate dehydrogenase [Flavobacteriales bacterium]|jgi:D-3-phosphoglycerate dehydrogenase|nr:3-phosphoglycerate dehydrogenase [Flavobacteriales bacterium]HIB76394.1 3-phosphoglycerate dehydrogenase [Flavobacteriales bacterium]HIN42248.1 3-phosphoglycerate dehydrogenase [Flavobacteriales bacterium]HIO15701.1 3-phosphoglycerate dehydrogenase [Flavobacteriales bacterium]HIO60034.1 3-phosphoglycerate dehydrogenase [Flavobacteriales bacterium]